MNYKSGENIWNLKLSCRSQFFLVLLNIFRCLVFSFNCKDYVYFHLLRAMLVTSSALCLNVGWNALFWFHSILKNLVIMMTMMMILSRQFRNWSLPYIFGRNVINSQNLLLNIPLKLSALGSVLLVYSLLFFSDFILLPRVSVNSTEFFFFFNRPKQKLQQLNKVPKEKP